MTTIVKQVLEGEEKDGSIAEALIVLIPNVECPNLLS